MQTWKILMGDDSFKIFTKSSLVATIIIALFVSCMFYIDDTLYPFLISPSVLLFPALYFYKYFTYWRPMWLEVCAEIEHEEYLHDNFGYYYDRIIDDKEF